MYTKCNNENIHNGIFGFLKIWPLNHFTLYFSKYTAKIEIVQISIHIFIFLSFLPEFCYYCPWLIFFICMCMVLILAQYAIHMFYSMDQLANCNVPINRVIFNEIICREGPHKCVWTTNDMHFVFDRT